MKSLLRLSSKDVMASQRGLAMIEFIIVLPILLIMSVLIIDVCRAFIQYTEVN
ncbi:pilus assembly protein, partial [Vibrio parahaemolyticus]|nr:pilus assembly protein [Vibrio parahaemolyticus]